MKTVPVDLGVRSYDICIGHDILSDLARTVPRGSTQALIVTDSNVGPHYAESCRAALTAAGMAATVHTVNAGEASKNLVVLGGIYSAAVAAHLDRKSLVVAVGGGVVGDMAGYAAATYLRGVRFMQVPTSLLAMVDSSVGGKTAINLPEGKNLVGAFYQPEQVLADLATLETLPEREYRSGLAEVVKYGVIRDADLFDTLEHRAEEVMARDPALLTAIVARSCEIKAAVVHEDEREGGVRAILNYGHTLGHAVENAVGYGELLHGEAVSIGMVYAAQLSARLLGAPAETARRQVALLARYGLPVRREQIPGSLGWDALRGVMSADKKSVSGMPRFVLSPALGRASFGHDVPEAVLQECFDAMA